jgi:hypothetical protein
MEVEKLVIRKGAAQSASGGGHKAGPLGMDWILEQAVKK